MSETIGKKAADILTKIRFEDWRRATEGEQKALSRIAELEAEVESLRDLSGIYDLAQMNGNLMSQVYAAESALKASREIADGLAGALRVFGKAAEDLDNPYCHPLDRAEDGMSIETAMWEHTQPTVGDLRTARQALLAYDAAQKGDGETSS